MTTKPTTDDAIDTDIRFNYLGPAYGDTLSNMVGLTQENFDKVRGLMNAAEALQDKYKIAQQENERLQRALGVVDDMCLYYGGKGITEQFNDRGKIDYKENPALAVESAMRQVYKALTTEPKETV